MTCLLIYGLCDRYDDVSIGVCVDRHRLTSVLTITTPLRFVRVNTPYMHSQVYAKPQKLASQLDCGKSLTLSKFEDQPAIIKVYTPKLVHMK